MLRSSTIEERILYSLSLDTQVRALAERHLERCAVTVGDLPASAAHRTGTSPACKFFQGENFFIPARSFLPTRWAGPRSMRLAQRFWAASRKKSLRAKQLFQNRRVQMGSQQNHTRWTVSPTPQTLHKLESPPPETICREALP
jgi:hypothetical protein